MKTIGELALSSLSKSGFPMFLWEQAYSSAVYCANRAYSAAHSCVEHKYLTPFERMFKIKPSVAHMVKFGSKAFVFVDKEQQHRAKLQDHCWVGFFAGYSTRSKAYLIYHPVKHAIFVRYHCWFNDKLVYGDLHGERRRVRDLVLTDVLRFRQLELELLRSYAMENPKSFLLMHMKREFGDEFQKFRDRFSDQYFSL